MFMFAGKAMAKYSFWATVTNVAGLLLTALVVIVAFALSRGAGSPQAKPEARGTEEEKESIVRREGGRDTRLEDKGDVV